jgi:hypothetical protein
VVLSRVLDGCGPKPQIEKPVILDETEYEYPDAVPFGSELPDEVRGEKNAGTDRDGYAEPVPKDVGEEALSALRFVGVCQNTSIVTSRAV